MMEKSIICPYCGSDNVSKVKKTGWINFLSMVLIALPLPFFTIDYYCYDCGEEFYKKELKTNK